jgi:uncharacterized RDD family membrane protein YckC
MIQAHPYAGFWRRVGGEFVDYLILLLPLQAISNVAAQADAGGTIPVAGLVMPWLLGLVYYVVGNGSGGTLGKRAVSLRVVEEAGSAPGMSRAAVRAVIQFGLRLLIGLVFLPALVAGTSPGGSTVPAWAVLMGLVLGMVILLLMALDYLWMLRDPRNQTLHDTLARTFVVRI